MKVHLRLVQLTITICILSVNTMAYAGSYNIQLIKSSAGGEVVGDSDLPLTENGRVIFFTNIYENDVYKGRRAYLWDKGSLMELGNLGVGMFGDVDGFGYSVPYAINEAGMVAGSSMKFENGVFKGWRGFLWNNGVLNELATLGTRNDGWGQSAVVGINNAGLMVGESYLYEGGINKGHRGVLWDNGNMIVMEPPYHWNNGIGESSAKGINEAGQVIGVFDSLAPGARGFLWSNGSLTELSNLSTNSGHLGYSFPHSINDAGQIAGDSDLYVNGINGGRHAVLWNSDGLTDIGALWPYKYPDGQTNTTALKINEVGQVLGAGDTFENGVHKGLRGFVWSNGSLIELPLLGDCLNGNNYGYGIDINDLGQVVGGSTNAGCQFRAFLYQNDVIVDLNELIPSSSGWTFAKAVNINNAGQILAYGTYNGAVALALLTPSILPIASAGEDQSVAENSPVTLDGSGSSDPQQQSLVYQWSQLAGPTVTLSNPFAALTSFTAPNVLQSVSLTFKLTVTDPDGNIASDYVDVTVNNVNHEPIAIASPAGYICKGSPPPATVRESGQTSLDGQCSYDVDGDSLTYNWMQIEGPPVTWITDTEIYSSQPRFIAPALVGGNLIFSLVVSDGQSQSDPSNISVTVVENSAPIADAGYPQTVNENTLVTLHGSINDPDSDILSFSWQQVSGPPVTMFNENTLEPSFLAPWVNPHGEDLSFMLSVEDNYISNPKSSSDSVMVHISNTNDPPNCHLSLPSLTNLWPPNHKLVLISIVNVSDPNIDNVVLTITGVNQDEPVNGTGDGDTSPDAIVQKGAGLDTVLLRSERAGIGNGRVYTIYFEATDGYESCTGEVKVGVPHNLKASALDDGIRVESTRTQ